MRTKKIKTPKTAEQKKETKKKIVKAVIALSVFLLIFVCGYLILKYTGVLNKIDSAEELKDLILSGGVWSYFIFMFLQFLQVTFLPLPAILTTLAGTWVFGPWVCALLSIAAVLVGSLFAFWLGKKLGKKIIVWIAGKEDAKKWATKLEKGKYVFLLMMLFPIFPDDILCMIVGTTNMSYRFFITTNLIARPISIFTTCFLGSGQLIPFHGWGIPVWIVLIILGAVLFYLSYKYQAKIEKFVIEIGQKISYKVKSVIGYEDPELTEKLKTQKQKKILQPLQQKFNIKNYKVFYESNKDSKVKNKNNLVSVMKLQKDDLVISEIKCYLKKLNNKVVINLKLTTNENYRSLGCMTQLLKKLVKDIKENNFPYKETLFHALVCNVQNEDIATIKVLEKNGFMRSNETLNLYEFVL